MGIEWLFQSIERGMALETDHFTLDIEPEKSGEDAWDRNAALKASGLSGVTASFDVVPHEENGGRKRKLRRAGSKIAQEGIWEGILGGVTEQHVANNQSEYGNLFDLPGPIIEEPTTGGLSMEIENSTRGLFDGMIFYTWGFTDEKVILASIRLTS